MKVEIWFDFTCPFSYIGLKNFNEALDLFANKRDVKVFYKTYNIAPSIKQSLRINACEYLAQHKDISYEEAEEIYDRLTLKGKEEGIDFNFKKLIPTSSCKAYNVFKLISDKCAQKAFLNYVFIAHFEEGRDISSLEVLTEIGKNVSLKEEDIKAVFETEMYEAAITNDFLKAENYDLTGVPAFVLDESYYLMGGHSKEAYLEMLDTFYRRATNKKNVTTELCQDESCS